MILIYKKKVFISQLKMEKLHYLKLAKTKKFDRQDDETDPNDIKEKYL